MAVVNSHRIVSGPLHGNVKLAIKGDGLRWVRHRLDRYVGSNLHVEFVPKDGFELLMVAQAPEGQLPAPEQMIAPDRDPIFDVVSGGSLAEVLSDALDAIGTETGEGRVTRGHARIANWMVRNHQLFIGGAALARVAEVAKAYVSRRAELARGIVRESRSALSLLDGSGTDEYVFIRGSYKSRGETVGRRFLEALGGEPPPAFEMRSGRLHLARQMSDHERNPFVSRVIVNRLWHHLLGRGIVQTTDDFGVLGQRPSHPELLDHLATSFVEDGWSLKRQIRRIVLSRTYQMSSRVGGKSEEIDPQNIYLHRASVRRLQGEAIRDSMLAISGRLDPKRFGPSVPVHLTSFMTGRGRPGKSGPLDGAGRRSIYGAIKRNFLSPMMLAFDTPIPFNNMGRRSVSNVPAQALILMNDPFVQEQAKLWGQRTIEAGGDVGARVRRMYLEAFARGPSEEELEAASAFVADQARGYDGDANDARIWGDLAHVLMNAKEFIFVN
jgi:hypothetical protein